MSTNEIRLVFNSFSIGIASVKKYVEEIRQVALKEVDHLEDDDQKAMVAELYRYADRYVETVSGERKGKGKAKEVDEDELEEMEVGPPLFFPDGEDEDADEEDAEAASQVS